MHAELDQNRVLLKLDRDQIEMANNALNEVCNGFKVANFDAAIGIPKEQAITLLGRIHHAEPGAPIDISLPELRAIRDALTTVLAELESWEYATRMGFEVNESERMRNDVDALAGELRMSQLHRTA